MMIIFSLRRLLRRLVTMVLGRRVERMKHDPLRKEMQKTRENHAKTLKEDYSHCFR